MKTLLIDNYDSYTFNLYQLLAEINDTEPRVVSNDSYDWSELAAWRFDNVVISPGPGRPERRRDFGVCAEVFSKCQVPVLGVCLGHQGLGYATGANIGHAPAVMHGRTSNVYHKGTGLFDDIPQGFEAVRYHSLVVVPPLPSSLELIAWAESGVIMGIKQCDRPHWGVQFHPESVCTSYGKRLLENFATLTAQNCLPQSADKAHRIIPEVSRQEHTRQEKQDPIFQMWTRKLEGELDTESAFSHLFGDKHYAFWLDSSRVEEGLSRFSFMGDASGPFAKVVRYDVASRQLEVSDSTGCQVLQESVFDYLKRELERLKLDSTNLPFDFDCGFVGYLGYELKADCGSELNHISSQPDATLLFADRVIAHDHEQKCTYLLCVAKSTQEDCANEWFDEVEGVLEASPTFNSAPANETDGADSFKFHLSRDRSTYVEDIKRCKDFLLEGETYEVCLTNHIKTHGEVNPLNLYRTVRHLNPAPYSAYLRLDEMHVISSSPERFLKINRDRDMEAKPIKGTAPRGNTLREDQKLRKELQNNEKNRAENLMIVDLLRNDLGRVSEVGTVHVPKLMDVESYTTVHQLVSTVRGRLRGDLSAVDCVQACFPGGSMTGAPKVRTMRILDELEREARGIYSGAIGFFGLGGAADLSIVIRTIVQAESETSIGVGGAIVIQSDPEEEFREIILKGQALVEAIATTAGARTTLALDDTLTDNLEDVDA